jgi:hypothetical protein
MRFAFIAFLLMFGSQAGAECGNLCDSDWWKTATDADVRSELDDGAHVMARGINGRTPLHAAAMYGTPVDIQALLDAGPNVMARDEDVYIHRCTVQQRKTTPPTFKLY